MVLCDDYGLIVLNSMYLSGNVSLQGCLDSLLLDVWCFRQRTTGCGLCAHCISALTLNSVWNEMPNSENRAMGSE